MLLETTKVRFFYTLLTMLLVIAQTATVALAEAADSEAVGGGTETILPAEAAFIPQVSGVTDHTITIAIGIENGYYLYRKRRFAIDSDDINIRDIQLSPGTTKTDAFFGEQSIWYGSTDKATVTLTYRNPDALKLSHLTLKYQGCKDRVICYPPQKVVLPVALPSALATIPPSPPAVPAMPVGQGGGQDDRQTNAASVATASQSALTSPFSVKANQNQHSGLFGHEMDTSPVLASTVLPKVSAAVIATQTDTNGGVDSDAVLPDSQAFSFIVNAIDKFLLEVRWRVADGYYLYRDKIVFSAAETKLIRDVKLAAGTPHRDRFFGEQAIFRGDEGIAHIYLSRPVQQLDLEVQFQGCAEKGVCYPIIRREIRVDNGFVSPADVDRVTGAAPGVANANVVPIKTTKTEATIYDGQGSAMADLAAVLTSNYWVGLGLLLLAGIALAFTPCVLPMLPILLGMMTNQHRVSRSRAALLSSAYAVGVATMMAVFGLIIAKTGVNIQIIFQKPLWLSLFAAIFIAMGLAMFGVFNLAMPNSVQVRVIRWQNHFQDAQPGSLFVVGALSALVVGPCVAPPLIAVLAFISTTGDSLLGALYLFVLGLGMSSPLVVFATVATSIPKAGAFSRLVTRVFAMLMFGVGLWLLGRLLPGAMTLLLWGGFMMALARIFWRSGLAKPVASGFASVCSALFFLVGVAWMGGAVMGNSNPLRPSTAEVHLPFKAVNNQQELTAALASTDKPVMLDLYADWCISCQEVEYITFANPDVVEVLQDFALLKLDITDTDEAHYALLREYHLIGPPALLFFADDKEITGQRHVGPISSQSLLKKLQQIAR